MCLDLNLYTMVLEEGHYFPMAGKEFLAYKATVQELADRHNCTKIHVYQVLRKLLDAEIVLRLTLKSKAEILKSAVREEFKKISE